MKTVYHYCALYFDKGRQNYVDGIATGDPIISGKELDELKGGIVKDNALKLSTDAIVLVNISKLGEVEDEPAPPLESGREYREDWTWIAKIGEGLEYDPTKNILSAKPGKLLRFAYRHTPTLSLDGPPVLLDLSPTYFYDVMDGEENNV